ncbi:MAG: polysaccharide deacetylase family protein [Candidatus Latescibacteria bacterium]|jgi:peptidoglycan/xylan/chitin deacetylase (PgdA/CDA1 family)|nr:polysaccharide deacetylase family protein [Candidatus Latescibacterota bacterium]
MGKSHRRDFLKNIAIVGASASLNPRAIFSQTSEIKRKKGISQIRIPITMCHGIDGHSPLVNGKKRPPLNIENFRNYFRIASEMDFTSISYDQLAVWKRGEADLPARPIMFDFDHPTKSIRHDIQPVMKELGFKGNLFIQTAPMEEMYSGKMPDFDERRWMTWEEIGELMDEGWHIGAHTHNHPNLSALSEKDPTGEKIREELVTNDTILKRELGITPKDFAFTGTSWSSAAEREVKKRYRFGRLWIIGSVYQVDGEKMRYAEFVGIPGDDEKDGGPPYAARYITKDSPPYKLPSMEFEFLIYKYDAFQRYLEGALEI